MRDMTAAHSRVYLDHCATTPLVPEAREALLAGLEAVGNPHATHTAGRRVRALIEEARESLAEALNAHPLEIVFTASGTESDNIAVLGAGQREGRPRVTTSPIEHPAVARACAHLAGSGVDLDVVPVSSDGHVDLDAAAELVGERTALVTVQWVNNEVGTVQPVDRLAAIAHAHGAWAHSDAAQAVGHVPVSFRDSGLDLVSVAGHKVGAPVGIGALLISRQVSVTPVSFGGDQERAIRSGTLSAPLVAALAAAVRRGVTRQPEEAGRLHRLRDELVAGIRERVSGVSINGTAPVSSAVASVTFTGVRAADLQFLLDRAGIDVSTGSACHSGVVQPSDVLIAMGRTLQEASSTLRFSLGWTSTSADVDRVLEALPPLVAQARAAA